MHSNSFRLLSFLVLFLVCPLPALAQGEERMEASASLEAKEAAPGDIVRVKLKLDVKAGFHTYPTTQKDPKAKDFVTTIRVKNAKDAPVGRSGEVKEPEPKVKFEQALGASVGYLEDSVEMEVPLLVKADAPAGPAKFSLAVVTQVCDEMGCVPFNKSFDFDLNIKGGKKPAGPPSPLTPGSASGSDESDKSGTASTGPAAGTSKAADGKEETLWSFTLVGIGFGFLTLLTPCVFPMIPITVSFFLKQEQSGQKAIVNALVYTLTIIVSMTVIAYAFVQSFQTLSQEWFTNFVLGALFIFFALSLFGMYEITLPAFLTRWTSAGEAKGGYLGTMFMALTFTLISFSCVAPFLGGFAGATAKERPLLWNLSGALGFSVTFALPFLALALFPSMLKKMPKSGNWLNAMKVVMGLLEVAAALKFLRTAEIRLTGSNPQVLTYDLVLALYIALCLIAALYLLGLFRMPHDEPDEGKIGVGRLLWSLLFFGLGIYLLPGLFWAPNGEKMRPPGKVFAWIDSFLLQASDTAPIPLGASQGNGSDQQKWQGFLEPALKEARSKKQRIFIDFTGVT
jgi:thiol:disulfide interchange protein